MWLNYQKIISFCFLNNTHKCSKKSKIRWVFFAFECQCKDEDNRCNSKHCQYPFANNKHSEKHV